MTFKLLHCLCLVLFEGMVLSMPAPTELNDSTPEWDYFLFVQQSPGGVCYFERGNNCKYPSNVTTWTMHGIWPTLNGTLGPNWCNPQATFALDKIEGILPQLVRQWPNLKTNTPFASFWSHEWLKHGTCAAAVVSSMQTENEFFSTVLGLHEKPMNFTTLLSSQGVHPTYNHTFRTDDFNNAFMKTMGVMPLLECLYSKEMGQVLFQVSVCLHKDFGIMPCAPYVFSSSRSRCWDDQEVHYIPNDTPL